MSTTLKDAPNQHEQEDILYLQQNFPYLFPPDDDPNIVRDLQQEFPEIFQPVS